MDSDRLEDWRSHGSPERIPGKLARAIGEFALSKGLFPSKESLASKLYEDLESYGVIYHVRTLKRQISGVIATVPPEVAAALAKLVFNGNGRRSDVDIRQLCAEAGISRPNGNESPAYVLSEKVLPLAQLWLHLNPQASKRALAIRLQRDLEKRGISYTVDTLQAILAGKNRLLVRPVIGDRLLEYLRDVGIKSRAEAEARIQAAEIGLIGRFKNKYNIYVGGSPQGMRLAQLYAEAVEPPDLIREIARLIDVYRANRQPQEHFGDFCHRVGVARLHELAESQNGDREEILRNLSWSPTDEEMEEAHARVS